MSAELLKFFFFLNLTKSHKRSRHTLTFQAQNEQFFMVLRVPAPICIQGRVGECFKLSSAS